MDFETAIAELRELPKPDPQGTVPEWIQILPAPDAKGKISARDGRSWYLDNPAQVVAALTANGASLAIDFDHAADNPKLKGDAERLRAAGWIEALELRDGAIWGRVEWTDRARDMLAAREWRYFSPVIVFDKKSHRLEKIIGGALVHRPALKMTALASEMPERPLALRLIDILGLEDDAADDAIIATIIQRLNLPALAAQTGATGAGAQDTAALDPTAVALATVMREKAELAAELRRRDAAERVSRAEATGAISDGTRDWALALAESDPETFDQWVTIAAPVFAKLLERTPAPLFDPATATLAGQSDTARIARALGIAPDRLAD